MADWFMEMVEGEKKRKLEEEKLRLLPADERSPAERIYGKRYNYESPRPRNYEVMVLANADGIAAGPLGDDIAAANAVDAAPPPAQPAKPSAGKESPTSPATPAPPASAAPSASIDSDATAAPSSPTSRKDEPLSASGNTSAKPKRAFDIDVFTKVLEEGALTQSKGKCAVKVRESAQKAGIYLPDHPVPARLYGDYLERAGMTKVDKTNYIPQKGDIAVFQAPPNTERSPDGHIQGFTGKLWYSDFKQTGPDIYPGPEYRAKKAAYEIYRP